MTVTRLWVRCFVILLLARAGLVDAHMTARSSSEWVIDSNGVRVTYVMPQNEVEKVVDDAEEESARSEALGNYLRERIHVSRDHRSCSAKGAPAINLHSGSATATFEWAFSCIGHGAFELTSTAFFDVSPSHAHLARVATTQGLVAEFAFTKDNSSRTIEVAQPVRAAGAWWTAAQFVRVGIWHIATGPDHIAFLLGVLLVAHGIRRVLVLTTGFTLGHSLTLALAGANIIKPNAQLVEALVAFSVMLVGADALGQYLRAKMVMVRICLTVLAMCFILGVGASAAFDRVPLFAGLALVTSSLGVLAARHASIQGPLHVGLTSAFGLIHGMAFAAGLQELRVSGPAIIPALAGFNVGVEVGQLLLVCMAMAIAAGLGRMRPAFGMTKLATATATALSCLGGWWFVTRIAIA